MIANRKSSGFNGSVGVSTGFGLILAPYPKQIKSVNTVLIKHNCLLRIIAFLVIQLKNNSAE